MGAHAHPHDHHGDGRRLALAAGLTGGFMLVEAVTGWLSGSLALLADAGHMLTDFASLVLAWAAARVSRRPADWQLTFGFDRFSVLAAFLNGIALFLIAGVILWEAVDRLLAPVPVMGVPMIIVAILGLGVNIIAFRLLHGGSGGLNIRSAMLHVAGDILGSVGAIVAAGVIIATGWTPADPILSVVVACLILGAGWRVVRDSGRILLEAVPQGVDLAAIAQDLSRDEKISRIHHLHAWAISEDRPMITLHAEIAEGADSGRVRDAIRKRLAETHGFVHATIEIERAGGAHPAPHCC
ncbi:cation transporter [Limibaculum sp. M0105]|uniref:Cation transporter n=1 Tax=Thermohalobaculum xanthum TaxID=2753746 RepID=A0A8J7SBZ8_9RHOB|nr:cation diffusion facilitator family transporter [Thermohalobaculum xanthum]MBK0397587.1 cation transporter [Thermohalobaculum xanthum]